MTSQTQIQVSVHLAAARRPSSALERRLRDLAVARGLGPPGS